MTSEQLQQRLSGIRRQSESLHGEGYTVPHLPVPSEACWDIRFLLAHIDGLQLQPFMTDTQSKLLARIAALEAELRRLLDLVGVEDRESIESVLSEKEE